ATAGILVSIVADDGLVKSLAATATLAVGDDAPSVQVHVPAGKQHDLVFFDYLLQDTSSDTSTLRVFYATASAPSTFLPATIQLTSSLSVQGDVPDRPAAPSGVADLLAWDSRTDLGPTFRGDVQLKLVPRDLDAWGGAALSVPIAISNNTPPSLSWTAPIV